MKKKIQIHKRNGGMFVGQCPDCSRRSGQRPSAAAASGFINRHGRQEHGWRVVREYEVRG